MKAVATVVIGCLLAAVGFALITAGVSSVKAQTDWMTRSELRADLPALRQQARSAAHGRVHGPSVTQTQTRFELTFRRGRRCRVHISLSRTPKVMRMTSPAIVAVGCAQRGA